MKSNRIPIVILAIITPFLTELLSANIPASLFFRPKMLLTLIVLYGLPVLAIREVSIRWKLGLWGIFCLGLAYGIFNEGICAKTLLMIKNVPICDFDGYSFLTLNLAWSSLIVPWHAFHAVLYPIVIVSAAFPRSYENTWLTKKILMIIGLLFTLRGIAIFFNSSHFTALPIYLAVFIGLIVSIIIVSRVVPQKPSLTVSGQKAFIYPAILGSIFYMTYMLGLMSLAQAKVPTLVLFGYAVLTIAVFYRVMKAKKWLTLPALASFGIGDYFGVAIISFFDGYVKSSKEVIITSIVFMIIFIIMIIYLKNRISTPIKNT
ncbi:MAG: hypothetical protein ABII88_02985 [Candidatus Omnitrophota bacterium]